MDSPSPPTAIFCWSDRIAYDLLEQCDRHGITVPDQLSIIGYDGLPWPAATRHQAASITVDLTALAEDAVQLLATTIRCELQKGVQQVIPVNLSLGTTLGPIIS